MRDDPSHEAEAFINALLRNLYARVQTMMFPHAREHQPGGKDQIQLDLGELHDVYAYDPNNGDTIVYNSTSKHWENGAGGSSGAESHQIYFAVGLTTSVIPWGPTNLTNKCWRIMAYQIDSDGEVSGTVNPFGFSFAHGVGGDTTSDSDYGSGLVTWDLNSLITIDSFIPGTDGNYLSINLYMEKTDCGGGGEE